MPAPENSHKTLKAVVIILGVLLIVGFLVLITTIAYRVINSGEDPSTDISQSIAPAQLPADILLPEGAKIAGIEADAGRLFVHVIYPNAASREEILVFDMATGRSLSKIRTRN